MNDVNDTNMPLPIVGMEAIVGNSVPEKENSVNGTPASPKVSKPRKKKAASKANAKTAKAKSKPAKVVASNGTRSRKSKAVSRIRQPFNFKLVKLAPGTILVSSLDPRARCRVVSERKVRFQGKETSLSKAALTVAHKTGRKWPTIEGPCYWTYKGETLDSLRPSGK